MSKEQFLKELRSKLNGLPQKDVDDRISFYSEMIDDRIDEGKSEEEAVAEIGSVDSVVSDIAKDTPLTTLVKERIKPKREVRAWEIILLILGFSLWFPLVLVAFILCLVAYLLIWVFVIVAYALELGFIAGAIGGIVIFFIYLAGGEFNIMYIGFSLMSVGAAILMFFGCIGVTKLTIKLSKAIFTGIKSSIIKKGRKNHD